MLGECFCDDTVANIPDGAIVDSFNDDFWMIVSLEHGTNPKMLLCFDSGVVRKIETSEFIFYRQPRTKALQYLSIQPLVLDLSAVRLLERAQEEQLKMRNSPVPTPSTLNTAGLSTLRTPPRSSRLQERLLQRTPSSRAVMATPPPHRRAAAKVKGLEQVSRTNDLYNQFMWHARPFVGPANPDPGEALNDILQRINESFDVERAIKSHFSAASLASRAGNLLSHIIVRLFAWLASIFGKPFLALVFLFRVIAEFIISLVNTKFPSSNVALKDISAGGELVLFPPVHLWYKTQPIKSTCGYSNLVSGPGNTFAGDLAIKSCLFYVKPSTLVWLVANDVIIGMALGAFLRTNAEALAGIYFGYLDYFTIHGISSIVHWLMGWPPPVGLKLNSELNHFLGQLFLWLLQMWNESLLPLRVNLPAIIVLIGYFGAFGASMIVGLCSDVFAITTLHIYVFYNVASKIYNWQVTVIFSLFTLFRGKKMNVLRRRVDSAEYDVDQLLLGTILFTVLVFLFPTSRVMIIFAQAVLEIVLAVLNHFPLFAIMLRIKDPGRLPEGLQFQLHDEASLPKLFSYFGGWFRKARKADKERGGRPSNKPIGMSEIFYQYTYLLERLRSNYLTSSATKSLFTGQRLERIPRLEYPTLPKRNPDARINVKELWSFFMSFGSWDGDKA
ncbi:phosphatidylinositol N-acetylglucosaminyltransferase subunit gpi1 [Phlyctochytrium planicorne]|nr:phosphatidylinositol N-acetylglucosaminyltransferase subunit gpi1 [Phlyctochytrium planicorne]